MDAELFVGRWVMIIYDKPTPWQQGLARAPPGPCLRGSPRAFRTTSVSIAEFAAEGGHNTR